MIENISINNMLLQLRFLLKNKDCKSKVRRDHLKLIQLNQLKHALGCDNFWQLKAL